MHGEHGDAIGPGSRFPRGFLLAVLGAFGICLGGCGCNEKVQGAFRTLGLLITLFFLIPLAACSSPTYGGKLYEVTVTTKPADVEAWAITREAWLNNGGEDMLSDSKKLRKHRMARKSRDDDAFYKQLRGGIHIFAIASDGKQEYIEGRVDSDHTEFYVEIREE